jgi:hypothetical protein
MRRRQHYGQIASLKWRANRGQEFVIGGYVLNWNALYSVLGDGYY